MMMAKMMQDIKRSLEKGHRGGGHKRHHHGHSHHRSRDDSKHRKDKYLESVKEAPKSTNKSVKIEDQGQNNPNLQNKLGSQLKKKVD